MKYKKTTAVLILCFFLSAQIMILSFRGILLGATLVCLAGITPAQHRNRCVKVFTPLFLFVLLFRLLFHFESITIIHWLEYAGRIISCAFLAACTLHYLGSSYILMAFETILHFLPRRIHIPMQDIARSTVYTIPLVYRRMATAYKAARIRLRNTGILRRMLCICRAVLLSTARIPEQRAAAMVVRGVLAHHHTEKQKNTAPASHS